MLDCMSTENAENQPAHAMISTPADQQQAQPKTHFEMMLKAGLNKPELSGSVMGAFMGAEVYFLSSHEVTEDNPSAQPMLLTNPAGAPMVAVFSTLGRIPSSYIDMAPYGIKVQGATLVRSLQNTGFVVNPGDELSFEVPAEGVKILQEQMFEDKK